MGSVAVLQPKDCLSRERFVNSGRRRPRSIPNSNPTPNPTPNMNRSGGGRRKRSPGRNSFAVDNNASPAPAKELVMEQVKILKRGEVLEDMTNTNSLLKSDDDKRKNLLKKKTDKKVKFEGVLRNSDEISKIEKVKLEDLNLKDDLLLSTTDWLGPAPEMLPNLFDNRYAGYSFGSQSPSPSSLPLPQFLPQFFAKKSNLTMDLSTSSTSSNKKSDLAMNLSTSPLPAFSAKKSDTTMDLSTSLNKTPLPAISAKKSLFISPLPAFSAKKSDPTVDLIRMLGLNL